MTVQGQTGLEGFDAVPAKTSGGDRRGWVTRGGLYPPEVTSAFQKEVRKGDEVQAVRFGLLLYDKSPEYAWRRLMTIAAEDVGFANPQAVMMTGALYSAWLGQKAEAKAGGKYAAISAHTFTFCVMLLCRGERSTEVEDLQSLVYEEWKADEFPSIPEYAIDPHTEKGRQMGLGWDVFYHARHILFKIPVNRYTVALWQRQPEWFSADVVRLLKKLKG